MPKQDECPRCSASGLSYEEESIIEASEEQAHVICSCPKCKWNGREVYNMEFVEYQTDE